MDKQNKYIVIQIVITRQEIGRTEVANIVRVVNAQSEEEEAIGKFIKNTYNESYVKKLDVECYLLDELKNIG